MLPFLAVLKPRVFGLTLGGFYSGSIFPKMITLAFPAFRLLWFSVGVLCFPQVFFVNVVVLPVTRVLVAVSGCLVYLEEW